MVCVCVCVCVCMLTRVGTKVGVHKLLVVPINSSSNGRPWFLDAQIAMLLVPLQLMSLSKQQFTGPSTQLKVTHFSVHQNWFYAKEW